MEKLYIGTYAGANEEGVRIFQLEERNAHLVPVGGLSGVENPSYIILNKARTMLYAASETMTCAAGAGGEVAAWRLSAGSQGTLMCKEPALAAAPCHLTLSPDEEYLLSANYMSGSVSVFPILTDGTVGKPEIQVQDTGKGAHQTRQEMAHMHFVRFTQDEKQLMAVDLGIDCINLCRWQAGRLTRCGSISFPAGSGPRHLAFSTVPGVLYAVMELSSQVVVLKRKDDGTYAALQTLSTVPQPCQNLPAAVRVAGRHLYISNRGHDSIALFDILPDGTLAHPRFTDCAGKNPRDMMFNADGRYLAVANQDSNAVALFTVDKETGSLTLAGEPIAVKQPVCTLFAGE